MITTLVLGHERTVSSWSGGTASDILVFPSKLTEDSSLLFRVSFAKISARVSQFSNYSGFTRIHQILSGKSRLRINEDSVELSSSNSQHIFDGGKPCHCELLSESVTAFNIMHREEICAGVIPPIKTSEVSAITLAQPSVCTKYCENLGLVYNLLFCVDGSTVVKLLNGGTVVELRCGDTFVIQRTLNDKSNILQFDGDATLVAANLLIPKKT